MNGSNSMKDKRKPSLLDALAEIAGCVCLSDLRWIKEDKRKQLADKLERIRPEEHPLVQWKDALGYLTSRSESASTEEIRQQLIGYFRKIEATASDSIPHMEDVL